MTIKPMRTKTVFAQGKRVRLPVPLTNTGPSLTPDDPHHYQTMHAILIGHGQCRDGNIAKLITKAIGCPLSFLKSGGIHHTEKDHKRTNCQRIFCAACEQERQEKHYISSKKNLLWDGNEKAPFGMLTMVAPQTSSTETGKRLAAVIERCDGGVKRLNELHLLSSRLGGPIECARRRTHVHWDCQKKKWNPHVHIVFRGSIDSVTLAKIERAWDVHFMGDTHVHYEPCRNIYQAMQYISRELTPIFVDGHMKLRERNREEVALRLAMDNLDVMSEYMAAKRLLNPKGCMMGFFRAKGSYCRYKKK